MGSELSGQWRIRHRLPAHGGGIKRSRRALVDVVVLARSLVERIGLLQSAVSMGRVRQLSEECELLRCKYMTACDRAMPNFMEH